MLRVFCLSEIIVMNETGVGWTPSTRDLVVIVKPTMVCVRCCAMSGVLRIDRHGIDGYGIDGHGNGEWLMVREAAPYAKS